MIERNKKPHTGTHSVKDVQTIVNEDEGNISVHELSCEDDDETQPPSDMEEMGLGLNLDQSTLEESQEDMDQSMLEESQEDMDQSTLEVSPEDMDQSTLEETREDIIDTDCTSQQVASVTMRDDDIYQLNETEDSQGFDPDTERESKEHSHSAFSQGQASGSCQDQASVGFQEHGAVTSQEHGDNLALRGSQQSSSGAKSPSLNHVSQMNLDSAKQVSGSQSTSDDQRTSTQNNQIDSQHVPLNRHYRAVLDEFQHVKRDDYFATSDDADLERCARGIYQLFEIYRIKLREAQRKCREKLAWSEPVKSGQHQAKTIDIKRRGKESIYVGLPAEDADFMEQKPEFNAHKRSKKGNKNSENDSGYDLPELIIENESSNESVSHGHIARQPLQPKHAEKEIISAETRLYGLDNNDIIDVMNDAKSSYGRGRPRRGRGRPCKETEAANNAVDNGKESKPTRGGPGRRLGRSTRNICPSPQTVPAKETQEDLDLQEALRISKCESQRSVSEAQYQDFDLDLLIIKQQDGQQVFENHMHKTKLHGYSIPKIGHSKGHQKFISPKQTDKSAHTESESKNEVMDERQLGNMPKEVNKDQSQSNHKAKDNNKGFKEHMPPTRGNKCKANKLNVTTLAEDTQDLDNEESYRSRRKRTRRNCFKLDSDSEDESIAESQDIDRVSEDTVIEDKQSDRDVKKKHQTNVETGIKPPAQSPGFIASVFNKVRKFVSPAKAEEVCVEEMINEEAGSQSPVLNKKRKLYTAAPKKYFSASTSDKNNIEYEFKAFRHFKSSSDEKKKLSNSTASRKDGKMNRTFDQSKDREENQILKVVKKFLSQPDSKESIVSDVMDLSTILDEKGDLYSTQYCEMKSTSGNERSKSVHKEGTLKTNDEAVDILILDDSSDEVYVMSEPEKTYKVKKTRQKSEVIKGTTVLNRKSMKISHNQHINQYYNKAQKSKDNENAPIDLDPELNHSKHELPERKGNINVDVYDIDNLIEDPLYTQRTEYNTCVGKSQTDMFDKTLVPIIHIPDVATMHEVETVNADINHLSPLKYDANGRHVATNKQNHTGRCLKKSDTLHHLNIDSENPPVILTNLGRTPTNNQHQGNINICGARPKTRHIEMDTSVYGEYSSPKRRRKVSETITSSECEAGTRGLRGGQEDVVGDNWGHVKGSFRKIGQHHGDDGNGDRGLRKTVVEMVACPLCNDSFPINIIEHHAANCVGDIEPQVDSDDIDAEDCIAHHMSQHRLEHHLSQNHMAHLSQHLHDPEHDHPGGLHSSHPAALHGHIEHLQDMEEDEEVNCLVAHSHDEHVTDVAKHIRCSPGEEGEIVACYICDAQIAKGKTFELHMNRCLELAAQQQMEVDKKGYHKVFVEPEEEAMPARNLRGRLRNPEEQIKAPSAKQHIDPATTVGTEEDNDVSSLYGRK